MEEAAELSDYLPLSFNRLNEQEYVTFLWDAFGADIDFSLVRVLTKLVLKYTLRVAHLELGGVNLDFAVEDDPLPSAEPAHGGDLVGARSWCMMSVCLAPI